MEQEQKVLYRQDRGVLRLALHPGQAAAWKSSARFVFVVAGTQSGKTSFGPWWLWREIQARGPGDYIAATATYDLFKLKMLPELKQVFVNVLGWGVYHAADRVLENHAKDTRIILRSANSEGGLESATGLAAWLDECGQDGFALEAWEATQRRLSLSEGRVLGTTTPYNLGWLKLEVYDRWVGGDRTLQVVQFDSITNPVFPKAEYYRAKRVLPGWKFEQFYRGQFSRPAGLIYGDFTDENLVADFPIPAEWPRYVGIDFGGSNTATVWVAHDVQHKAYYVYRETLEGGMSSGEHAAAAKRRAGTQERVIAWIGGAKSETQQRADWSAAGIPAREPAIVDVEAGIDRVIEVVKTRQLLVFESMRGLRDEFGTYTRKLDDMGQPTDVIKNKERFHRLDALRGVMGYLRAGGVSQTLPDSLFVGGRRGGA